MVPAVAEGEDEGSQRSAATLIMRMWPLTSHVKSERAFWNSGLNSLHKIILRMMEEKKLYGITKRHLELRLKSKWHPILPRDRQAFVEELVARMGVNLGSPEHLLALAGDVEDIDLVMDQTREWLGYLEEIKKLGVVPYGSQGDSGGQEETQRDGGRAVSNSNESTGSKRPQASGARPRQRGTQKDNKASS